MNIYQAMPSEQLTQLRDAAAAAHADAILVALAREFVSLGADDALERFRNAAMQAIADTKVEGTNADAMRELSDEEIVRVVQIATRGKSELRGWTKDAPAAVEEQKP